MSRVLVTGASGFVGRHLLEVTDGGKDLYPEIKRRATKLNAEARENWDNEAWHRQVAADVASTLRGLIEAIDLAQPWRRARMLAFAHPDLDPQGAGFHINQSLIAVGSGGTGGLSRRQLIGRALALGGGASLTEVLGPAQFLSSADAAATSPRASACVWSMRTARCVREDAPTSSAKKTGHSTCSYSGPTKTMRSAH